MSDRPKAIPIGEEHKIVIAKLAECSFAEDDRKNPEDLIKVVLTQNSFSFPSLSIYAGVEQFFHKKSRGNPSSGWEAEYPFYPRVRELHFNLFPDEHKMVFFGQYAQDKFQDRGSIRIPEIFFYMLMRDGHLHKVDSKMWFYDFELSPICWIWEYHDMPRSLVSPNSFLAPTKYLSDVNKLLRLTDGRGDEGNAKVRNAYEKEDFNFPFVDR